MDDNLADHYLDDFHHNNLPVIDQIINNGQPQFGVFRQVRQINYLDYYSHLISQQPVANWRKEFKSNQFAFIQIVHPPYRICLALATIKIATSAFVYLFNEHTQQLEVIEALRPLKHHSRFEGDHYQGQMVFAHSTLNLTLTFQPSQISINLTSNTVCLTAQLARMPQPLAVCSPSGRRGWVFTQKEPLKIVSGELIIHPDCTFTMENQTETIELNGTTLANLDWTLGYMRHETNWFWSCLNTTLPDGRWLLLNLSMGVNETGLSENACWLDGRIYYLPPVMFTRPDTDKENDETKPWRIIHHNLGWSQVTIDLTFKPITVYQKTDNFGVVASIFEQWVGEYSGTIQFKDQLIVLDKVLGLAEDHFAKW